MKNKLAHGIVLAFYMVACWLVWVWFKVPLMIGRPGSELPGFTQLCVSIGPAIVIALAVVAIAYCIWIWSRKGESRNSWVAFLATVTSALMFVSIPGGIATSLALISALHRLPLK